MDSIHKTPDTLHVVISFSLMQTLKCYCILLKRRSHAATMDKRIFLQIFRGLLPKSVFKNAFF